MDHSGNAAHVEAGRLTVTESAVRGLDVPQHAFDKAFSVDVNLFWTGDPAPELTVLKRALKPGGRWHILYGGGPADTGRVIPAISEALTARGFAAVEALEAEHGVGVSARSPEGA